MGAFKTFFRFSDTIVAHGDKLEGADVDQGTEVDSHCKVVPQLFIVIIFLIFFSRLYGKLVIFCF